MTSIPYTFETSASAAQLRDAYDSRLEVGERSDVVVSIAGRMMLRRTQGKLAFATLADSTGRIQLFATQSDTGEFERFTQLSLGDWIGVQGTLMKTKRGELSVHVETWVLLAPTQRQFPDKWHGLSDADTRYRQRYVDLWVTESSRQAFVLRSRLISAMRRWLENEGFMEVETPILQSLPGGADALPFVTHHNALDMELYLRIAPELYLKRLTVGGFEKVFEIGRLFRNEGISPRHNPEFTSMEWYEAYTDTYGVMARAERMVAHLAELLCGGTILEYDGREVDLRLPWRRATMAELIEEQIGVLLSLDNPDVIREQAEKYLDHIEPSWGPGKLVLEIYEKTTEPKLWGPIFVCEYPKEVSPLARDHRDKPGMTERFECIIAGRELMNGFSELVDPAEQRARFEDQMKKRASGDGEAMRLDEDYLRAMEYGLPPTGGIGVGIDRLVMLFANANNIRDVVLFPTLRAEQQR